MIEVVPAVIPQSIDYLREKLLLVKGLAETVQIDVLDGVFVPNRSWPMNPGDRSSFERILLEDEGLPYWEDFNFEVDLMAHHPETLLPEWVKAGITRAVIHLESDHDIVKCREVVGDAVELGLAIDLDPPYEKVASYIDQIQYIQVMGIGRLGKQGEPADERAIALIKRVRSDFPNVTIQVDGGVNDETAPDLIDAGADRLVAGSYILRAESPKEAIKILQSS